MVDWSDLLRRYLLVSADLTMTLNWNHLAPVERAERLPGDPGTATWFEEDYCEGPGQALIVNPRGEVKPCCGFASDLDQLTIGNIYTRHASKQVIAAGRQHPYVGKVFREGLTAIRDEILARDPDALPGATSNHCYFCWYVLTRGPGGRRQRRRRARSATGRAGGRTTRASASAPGTSRLTEERYALWLDSPSRATKAGSSLFRMPCEMHPDASSAAA